MGEVQKVVIDTNIVISAFGWGGKPLVIMDLLEKGEIRNCISEETLQELAVALAYPKLGFSLKTQSDIIEFILGYSSMYRPKESLALAHDPEDNKFIECAAEAHASFIISGDKGLLAVKKYQSIQILTPQSFLQRRSR